MRARIDALQPDHFAIDWQYAFMRVGDLDLRIDLPVQGFGFLSLIVPPLSELDLRGRGRLTGHLAMSRGEVLPGTDLLVEAHALAMRLGPYDFSGDGSVEFVVDPDDGGRRT